MITPKWRVTSYEAEMKRLEDQLAAERERADHYEAVAQKYLNTHLTLVDALKVIRDSPHIPSSMQSDIDATLAKVADQPVQLPMINDDPVITLK